MSSTRGQTTRHRIAMGVLALIASAACILCAAPPVSAVPSGAWWYSAYELPKVWKISEGAGVTVAVIDTGLQRSVTDLKGQVLPGIDLTGGTNPNVTTDSISTGTQYYGHGTDMAAKIAGTGKGAGMIGVAPKAKILPIDVGSSGALDLDAVAEGIRQAVDRGAKIINLSLGLVASCDSDQGAAIKYAYQHDVIVVAAAGDSPGPVSSPANCPGAIAVGGIDADSAPWTETPTGPQIDFVGPAYNLVNEEINNRLIGPSTGNYGTSTAAAITSGFFALLRSHFPTENARQIVTRALYAVKNGVGVQAFGTRTNNTIGYGELIPYYALTTPPPANAKNPIYDQFATELGPPTPNATPSTTSNSPGSTPPSTPTNPTAKSDSSDSSPAVPILVVVAVLIAAAGAIFLIHRRRTRTTTPPNGPGGYPPPPPPSGY